ncbi:MAG TPA: BadF/BadG/BcrA/BcrD ATPase family protein [Lacunisphaera sp.]|jgi:N-acetylglucosamine kinase-like BadF-type ATPase|nr:BadF/BadG/BcrA/BcrD ATPase family protein [Lacunisphaera sp.]
MAAPLFKIGVDGGGTKTECILVDAGGKIAARHLAPGCNPSQTGPDRARTVLQEALQAITANLAAGSVEATLLCMAGNRAFWRDTAATLRGYGRVTAADDSLPVLELATAGAAGLVLHAGTGSFVAARAPDGSVHYAGGLGWKFGDAGSGFDLGRRALALALLELQAASPGAAPSPLAAALCAHTGLADYTANSRFFYYDEEANTKIAAFAPVVLDLAAHDNGPAQQVVADSVTELARLADQVIHRLFPSPAAALPCGVSGRVLNSVPAAFALRSLASKLRWPVELRFIDTPPSEGIRRLLTQM